MASPTPAPPPTPTWPSAAATRAENARPGSPGWITSHTKASLLSGWAERVSLRPGQLLGLRIRSAQAFTATAYRVGYYGGVGARALWHAHHGPATQPAARMLPATRTVSAATWHRTLTIPTAGFPPGEYVVTLRSGPLSWWVPFTVLAPSCRGALAIVSAVTTWQAYNLWGGRSLYSGPGGYLGRSYAVSFDRPYGYGNGAADFWGNERPATMLAERLNLPLCYLTDVDLDASPHILAGARAVISLGHDEYYSAAMVHAIALAESRGINVAFLGANAAFRHMRLAATPIGPRRLEIDYKNGALDPVAATDPAEATYNWPSGPDPRPESRITGAMYQCNGVSAALAATGASSFLTAGLGLRAGTRLPGLVGDEYDQVDLMVPTPRPMTILFHSPLVCSGSAGFQDTIYATLPSGAGLFDASTSSWVCALTLPSTCAGHVSARSVHILTAITARLLLAFAAGPAGRRHPATDNLHHVIGAPRLR